MSILNPTEQTVLRLRRHPIVFLKEILVFLFLMIVPLVAVFLANITDVRLPNNGIVPVLVILGGSVYYLYLALFIFYNFFIFFLDRWIVTNQHIIDIEQHTMFRRTTSRLELERIQDITSETRGILQTIFHFGNVYVQTAGERERFVFEDVPAPGFVANTILRLVDHIQKK
ncbi:MAG: PH domain-containing protein [Patescibacteria group bacterium]